MNKHAHLLLLVILVCFPFFISAQRGSIKGELIDATTTNKIAYAGVTLMNAKDTSLIKGVMSEKEGTFLIENIAKGDYIVQVFYTGYEKWFSETVSISSDNSAIDLGVIRLTISATTLEAAMVTSTKPLFENKPGKIIMNVEAAPTTAGDNVLELLKKVPNVMVDNDDNISLNGKSGVTIFMDDKRLYVSGDDLTNMLKNMSASMIDRIEVVKNPSAKYDAEGVGGIINIVTKRDQNLGFNGSVWASAGYGKTWKSNDGFNLNVRSGKFVLTAGYGYNLWNYKQGSRLDNGNYRNEDLIRITTNELDKEIWGNRSRNSGHNFNLAGDYHINKKNVVGFSYRGQIGNNMYEGQSFTRIYTNSAIDSSYSSISEVKNKSSNHSLNLNYKHTFDSTGKVLFADFDFSYNDHRRNTPTTIDYYTDNFLARYRTERRNSMIDPGETQVYALKVDYEHPFSEVLRLEAGIKSSIVINNNRLRNTINDSAILSRDNHFVYKENINSAYALLSANPSEKATLQMGLRGEYSYTKGILKTTNETNTQNYFDIFPTLQVGYELPKKNHIDAGYRYRISRPNYYILNPFIDITDDYNIYTGNPNLKPEYTHSVSFSHSWNYLLFTSLEYSYSKDAYTYMQYTDPNTSVRLSSPENIGKSHALYASIYARIPIGSWWVMTYYLSGNYGRETIDYGNTLVKQNTYGGSIWTSHTFNFLKNYSAELSGYYGLPSQETFGKNNQFYQVNLALKGNFLKKTLTVVLSANNLLGSDRWVSRNIYPDGSTSNGTWLWESRSFWLRISYRFGKQDIQTQQRRSGNNDEMNRIGGGGNNQNSGGAPR